jgi:hypothetical protein
LQLGIQFLAAASDGIDVQTGDEGEQGIATIAGFLGLQGSKPAALLLVQAAHEKVDLVVQLPVGMILSSLAVRTGTRMNHGVRHDESSAT